MSDAPTDPEFECASHSLGMATLLDHVSDGLVLLDAGHHATSMNRPGAHLLRLLIGTDSLAPDPTGPSRPIHALGTIPLEALLKDGEVGIPRDVIVGEPMRRVISVRVLRAEELGSALLVLRDVTHLRARQAREWADERMASLGKVAAGVAHDLNNLLTVVLNQACVIEWEPGAQITRQSAREIRGAAVRAASLVQQILSFRGRHGTTETVVDVSCLLRDLEGTLRWIVGERVRLQMSIPAHVGWVAADPAQLERVLMNLTANARDAMHGGTGRIIVEATALADAPELSEAHGSERCGAVCLRVSDAGVGMDPGTQARIFEPGFTTSREGRGIGLTNVHDIVTRLRGRILVSSRPGEGSDFRIVLPRIEPPTIPPKPVWSKAGPRSGRILVLEDSRELRDALGAALSAGGYDTIMLAAPEAVLAAVDAEGEPDLLILSLPLARGSGAELLRSLRTRYPQLPVLATTCLAPDDVEPMLAGLSNTRILMKPFTGARLLQTVELLVGQGFE